MTKKSPDFLHNDDRVQILITVERQPEGNFRINLTGRKRFEPFPGGLTSYQSPTRLVWAVDSLLGEAATQMLFRHMSEMWDGELERHVVDATELWPDPTQPTAQ